METPILIAFLVVLFAVLLAVQYSRAREIRKLLDEQATKRDGRVSGLGFFSHPRLDFSFSEDRSKDTPPCTYVIATPGVSREVQFTIRREDWWGKTRKSFGVRDIDLGNPAFDDAFLVEGDESLAREVLVDQVQQVLIALLPYRPAMTCRHSNLMFSVEFIPFKVGEYDVVIDAALVVLDQLG
jgi:hypothetical protein